MNASIPLQKGERAEPSSARSLPECALLDQSPDPYDGLQARLRRQYVPYSVLWELTHRCNLKCIMCYNEPLSQPELSTAECFTILPQLAEAGTLRLTFTGGEILTRPDFFLIAEEARRQGFALDLKTNGALISPEIADRIAGLAPVQVDISLMGATPKTFDAIAGSRRTQERVLRGVKLLRQRNVRVKLNTLLLGLNFPERQQMIDLAMQLGVQYEQVVKISPTDSGGQKAPQQQLSLTQMQQALVADKTPCAARDIGPESRTCGVALTSCVISPYGVVYPCLELREPAGNLRAEPFAGIWSDAAILTDLRARHMRKNLDDCFNCTINVYCEGRCAGIAWKEHGNAYGGHTLACWHAQARYAEQHPGIDVPETPYLRRSRAS